MSKNIIQLWDLKIRSRCRRIFWSRRRGAYLLQTKTRRLGPKGESRDQKTVLRRLRGEKGNISPSHEGRCTLSPDTDNYRIGGGCWKESEVKAGDRRAPSASGVGLRI